MPKNTSSVNYALTFPLKNMDDSTKHKLEKLMVLCGIVEDRANDFLLKNYRRIIRTPEYRKMMSEVEKNKKENKQKNDGNLKKTNSLRKKFFAAEIMEITTTTVTKDGQRVRETNLINGYTDYSIRKLCSVLIKSVLNEVQLKEYGICSRTAECIGQRIWAAWEKKITGEGKSIKFNNGKPINSIPYSKHQTCIYGISINSPYSFTLNYTHNLNNAYKKNKDKDKRKEDYNITLTIDDSKLTDRDKNALQLLDKELKNIARITLIRKQIRGKDKYYLQINFKDTYIIPKNNNIGNNMMGIDPGPSSIHVYTTDNDKYATLQDINLTPFTNAEERDAYKKKCAELERKMDRSRRINNPDNYKEDGILKRRKDIKGWIISNNYKKYKKQHTELKRKIADKRSIKHRQIAKQLLSTSNHIIIEGNDFSTMMKRKKGIRKDKNGKTQSNKQYGKSIGNSAVSGFLTHLQNVGKLRGAVVEKIDKTCAGTQFDPILGNKSKKKVERFDKTHTLVNGNTHGRDHLAAFNICYNISYLSKLEPKDISKAFKENDIEKIYDVNLMRKNYNTFCKAEEKVIKKV